MKIFVCFIFILSCNDPSANLFFNRTHNLLFKEQKFKIYQHPRELQLSHEIEVVRSEGVPEIIVYPRTKHFISPHINYQHPQQFIFFEYDGVVNFEKIRNIEFTLVYSWKKSNPLHMMTNAHRDSVVEAIEKAGINNTEYTYLFELVRDYSLLFRELDYYQDLRIELKNITRGEQRWQPYDYKSIKELSTSIDNYKIRFILPLYSGAPVKDGFPPPWTRGIDYNVTTYQFPEINFLVQY